MLIMTVEQNAKMMTNTVYTSLCKMKLVTKIVFFSSLSLFRTVDLYKRRDGKLVVFKKISLDNMTEEEEKV
jgi:hypothetical protein